MIIRQRCRHDRLRFMSRGSAPRILTAVAVFTMAITGIGFVAMLIGNTFLFDKYDAYGEVPIPGSSSLHLPAGDVTVTFHTIIIGGTSGGGGLPVPPLKYRIGAPEGVEEPVLTEDYGTTTTVNNDARVRLGFLHVPVEGTYDVKLEGNVSAYLNPTLAFGHGSLYTSVPWLLAAVFGVAVVVLVIARVWAARVRRRPVPVDGYSPPPQAFGMPTYGTSTFGSTYEPPTYEPRTPYVPPAAPREPSTPTEDGIRIEQLNTLARLRDSGALTEDEFQAEKRRILDGP